MTETGRRLEGKVALVSGGNRSIGATLCEGLAKEGALVVVGSRDPDAAADVIAAIESGGGAASAVALEVTSEEQWEAAVAHAVGRFGGLDILVNNAGILETDSVADMSWDVWQAVQTVNVGGVFLGTKHAVRAMRPGGASGRGGSIINIGSLAAVRGVPHYFAYGASKGAVSAMTRHVAMECASEGWGIRVNQINPGVVLTQMTLDHDGDQLDALSDMHPLGLAPPEDLVGTLVYLASEDSKWLTGAEIPLDGGISMSV